ncbi:hypothetical protein [Paraburkholderia sp. J11-2]|uniref:hypothetical protein n=1 Tax=Paraburkholderia sp. J11-2 TaxID=2805431 RepID=UPI002AB6AE1E|nr:hypothetical protein [Paraburkholderia sp. J11-2]
MVQAIIQTLAQLGLNLPLSSDTNTGVKPSDTKTAATGGTQSTNASSRDTSLPAADIDAVFENFIGQILQMASSAQQDGATSSASQSDMGSIVNEATTVHYSNPLAQALESLAQAVGARSSEPRNESANGGTGSTKLDSTISSLEQNFNTLFDSSSTENAASLQTFLEKFASNVAQESASQSSVTFVRTSA